MAQRKKRATLKGKSTARAKARKASKSARGKAANRTVAKPTPKKRLAKPEPKRAGAKKVARKKVRSMKPPSTPAVQTVVVDVIEEPVPGVTVVTEFEAIEVREPGTNPDKAKESQDSTPRESEEP
jgi:hypothetical protein